MSLSCYVLILIAAFAGIGQLSTPVRERTPLLHWSFRDVFLSVWRGLHVFAAVEPHCPLVGNVTAPERKHPVIVDK